MDHWKPGKAIIFYCGSEGNVVDSSQRSGFLWELGLKLCAMVVFAEHRYYGESLPFGNKSFSTQSNFAYLTSSQALADYATLVSYLKGSIVGADHSAVIAIGGSYGGMLAAWLRQKYPHLIAGALASSAPVLMVGNVTHCNYPYEILTNAYKTFGGIACTDNIKRLWSLLHRMNTSMGLISLTKVFRLCEPLKDVGFLMTQISNLIFEGGVVNYPYPHTLFRAMPASPVKKFCKVLSSKIVNSTKLFTAVSNALQLFYNHSGQSNCLSFKYVETLDDTAWSLQTCMEIPMPMCSSGVKDMFYKNEYDKNVIESECEAQFKMKPRPSRIQTQFGGGDFRAVSNIIFSNGLLDPWSAGGIFNAPSDTIHIVRIPTGAHCADLKSTNRNDFSDIRIAKEFEENIIKRWITEWV